MPETSLFKDTVTDLNQGWRDLLQFYETGDCRVSYLRSFEAILSQNLPDEMLWQRDDYKRVAQMIPLSENPRQRIAPGQFYNYMILYEQIMRRSGLIDKAPVQMSISLKMFDLGDEL